ncbi:hypothetical protein P4112_02665 [Pseudomonas aeruginosa]|nr:hypothetical protein [Pseudomonas aeruginosa]
MLSPTERVEPIAPSLNDPVRAVRLSAAYALLPAIAELGTHGTAWRRAIDEYEGAQLVQRERAEANLNLANLYRADGRSGLVEGEPAGSPAPRRGLRSGAGRPRPVAGKRGPRQRSRHAVARGYPPQPQSGLLHYARGLALIRQGKREAARQALAEAPAAERTTRAIPMSSPSPGTRPDNQTKPSKPCARCSRGDRAERAARLALADYLQQAGDAAGADAVLVELRAINPDDPLFR